MKSPKSSGQGPKSKAVSFPPAAGHSILGLRVWTLMLFFAARIFVQADDSTSKEYQVKAAYLYNFAKFVEWPAQRFANAEAPLVIGVFGENPFGDELRAIARNHKINGRDIVILPVTTSAEARAAQMVFFSAAEDAHAAQELGKIREAGVLTVGESEKFIAAGGMIAFVREGDKVRFEINAEAAEQQGLKISAQLLKLAKPIHK